MLLGYVIHMAGAIVQKREIRQTRDVHVQILVPVQILTEHMLRVEIGRRTLRKQRSLREPPFGVVHQNPRGLPSHHHDIRVPVPVPVQIPRGRAVRRRTQVGQPRVTLLHEQHDPFRLAIGLCGHTPHERCRSQDRAHSLRYHSTCTLLTKKDHRTLSIHVRQTLSRTLLRFTVRSKAIHRRSARTNESPYYERDVIVLRGTQLSII